MVDIAGNVSTQMLRHYSHIRMEAKRNALESIVKKPANTKGENMKGQSIESLVVELALRQSRTRKSARSTVLGIHRSALASSESGLDAARYSSPRKPASGDRTERKN